MISLEVAGKLLFTNCVCPFAGDKGREFNIPHLLFLCPMLTCFGRMRQIVFICCSAPALPRGAVLAPAQNACCLLAERSPRVGYKQPNCQRRRALAPKRPGSSEMRAVTPSQLLELHLRARIKALELRPTKRNAGGALCKQHTGGEQHSKSCPACRENP